MEGWKLAWIPLWADLPLHPVWIRPWGCAHLWGLGYLQGILLGKLVTGKPPRPGHWTPLPGASALTYLCSLIYCRTFHRSISTGDRGHLGLLSSHQRQWLKWRATSLLARAPTLDWDFPGSLLSSALNSLYDPRQASSPPWAKPAGCSAQSLAHNRGFTRASL